MKLGLVTIGQAPRDDLTTDFESLIPGVELVQAGALDYVTLATAQSEFGPKDEHDLLVSRMRTGESVVVGEHAIKPLLADAIDRVERSGAALTLLACSGHLPEFPHRVPLLYPDRVVTAVLSALKPEGTWGIVCPDPRQFTAVKQKYARPDDVCFAAVNPYGGDDSQLAEAGAALAAQGASFILCDCIGYSLVMRDIVRAAARVPVMTVRSLAARVAAEWMGAEALAGVLET